MEKYADYIDRVFREENSAAFMTPGHQEIELALIKMYRHTGKEKYLTLAKHFVDLRGANDKDEGENAPLHALLANQSHAPVREMTTAEGHAVRASYLYSAMADLARETGDEKMFAACRKIFENIVFKRMYVTGGVGSSHYTEAYTVDYDLPNDIAYTETCASIALAYFARRMLTMDADRLYADVIEKIIYNGFLSATSLDGKRFYYSNPLFISQRSRGRNVSSKDGEWLPADERVEVFSCSCCPPNITRFVASIAEYMYTADEDTVYAHQFMGADAGIEVGGRKVTVKQETEYPLNGRVKFMIRNASGLRFAVRIPGWCEDFTFNHPFEERNGYAVFACEGDAFELEMNMDMRPVLIEANPEVQADAGRVCVMRGPVVYCMEGIDNGARLQDVRISMNAAFCEEYSEEMHMPVLQTKGLIRKSGEGWLYRKAKEDYEEKTITLIPYYAFANRGKSDMQVWTLVKA